MDRLAEMRRAEAESRPTVTSTIGSSGHARPPPLGCGRSPPYLRLVTGVRLASPGSSLAEATFAPAQPPFMVTELLGEKTNLTQKKPYLVCRIPVADLRFRAVHNAQV